MCSHDTKEFCPCTYLFPLFLILLCVWFIAYAAPVEFSVEHWFKAIVAPIAYGGIWGTVLYAFLAATSLGTVGPLIHDYVKGKHVTCGTCGMIILVLAVWIFFGTILIQAI